MKIIFSGLKADLIKWYRDHHSTMPLSPLCDELEVPLLNFYILPEMNCFDVQKIGGSEVRARVESFTDIFWTIGNSDDDIRENKEIFVVADAGCGKTAFIKYLTLAWCQAHSPDPEQEACFKEEDLKHLRAFEFLFLVLLRDSLDVCCVDDMIFEKVISNMPNFSIRKMSFLQEIMNNDKTLVLLDGMDEWTHHDSTCHRTPKNIPHRVCREHCTILTTLRPWKFSNVSLKNSEVDNRIEFRKPSMETVRKLGEKAIASLKPLDHIKTENLLELLNEKITKNSLEDFVSNPLLLLHLTCLFYEDSTTAKTKSKICSSIIDLYLARTLKYPGPKLSCEPVLSDVPQYFRGEDRKEKYEKLLMSIGKLAFHTLFSEDQKRVLVFKDSFVKKYLSSQEMRMGILTGILSEQLVRTLIRQYSNISFPQKMLQEYLCAKYISSQSMPDIENVILTGCTNLQNILHMSTLFQFVSDMNKHILSYISQKLMHVINEDEITQNYRTRTDCDKMYAEPLNNIQNMFMACIKDTPEDKVIDVCLQDLFIHVHHDTGTYIEQLATLLKQNKDICDIHVRSVFIDDTESACLSEIIDLLTQSDLSNVQKVFYRSRNFDGKLAALLADKLKCLTLIFEKDIFGGGTCSIMPTLCRQIVSLQHLEYTCIMNFTMCHEAIEAMFGLMTKKDMKEIRLQNLSCADHGISCRGFNLDLSQHSDLRRLGFGGIPLSQLSINVSALEECHVGALSKPGLVSACLQQLPAAEKLQTYVCSNLASFLEIDTMRQTLPSLVSVKQLAFHDIDLGQRSLTLSPEMVNIEVIQLYRVTISSTAFHDLVKVVEMLPLSVMVLLQNCNVAPDTEFKYLKKYISSSGKFVVPVDERLSVSEDSFAFKTIR